MAGLTITAIDAVPDIRLLRLMQLVSPALPVGAFAYSQGLEWAVQAGWVADAGQAGRWISGLLTHCLANFDVPVLRRLWQAWRSGCMDGFDSWNQYLLAGRGSAELQGQECHMGQALLRLLGQLQPDGMMGLTCRRPSFTAMFAAAACNWNIEPPAACAGFLWSWSESQVTAAVKLIPLGQTDGQRILMALGKAIPEAVRHGLSLGDEAVGAAAPGLAMASALHETQHTRLFRS